MGQLSRPFTVEPVQVGDLKHVMRLAWRNTTNVYPFDFFDQIARHQREYFRVVREEDSGRILGFIIAAQQPNSHQNFLLLVIDPEFKGLGLRRALLTGVQEQLAAEGRGAFTVEVASRDEAAIEFYRSNGFEVVGVESGGPPDWQERVLLEKALGGQGAAAPHVADEDGATTEPQSSPGDEKAPAAT